MGEARWLTVVSPEGPEDIELLLEPTGFAAAKTYQKALFEAGIPLASFAVEDIQKEYERMRRLGVVFSMEPTTTGPATVAVFDDTCGKPHTASSGLITSSKKSWRRNNHSRQAATGICALWN